MEIENNTNNKDSLLILSGGMDSVSMLHEYAHRIALAITFDYGSNHAKREIPLAKRNCELLNIEHLVIKMPFIHNIFKSSLLEGAKAIPEGNYDSENMKSTVVPFRNGIMLSIAAGVAESRGLPRIMIANHAGDHFIYPDCREEFISDMDSAICSGTDGAVHIFAPYTNLTKAEVAKRGAAAGVDFSLTYSCYKGGEKHCGKCGTCMERKEAFKEAGIVDVTDYED